MGQRHHTEIIEGCSFSLSFHLDKPAPVSYYNDVKKILSDVGMEESDRFFTEIRADDVRYMHRCGVVGVGEDSFVVQEFRPEDRVDTGN